ncbi:MAG TPA: hypothetical protein VF339_10675 [Gammaproteobacteria bacterium]
MADPILTERLAPGRETRLDVYLFFLAFGGGLVLYFGLKLLGFGQLSQTAAIVSTMLLYAAAVAKVPRLRVRLDQAGDNAYYLGLLFTLVSMAVTLYEFRGTALGDAGAQSGAEHIIANFGVALASTIAGIFLRVLLHQMRVDPADVESMTRIELADASKRVKAQLDQVSGNIALYQGQAAQRLNDVLATASENVTELLTAFTTEVGQAMVELLGRTEEAQKNVLAQSTEAAARMTEMADSAREAMERLREVEPPPQKLATRLNKVCDGLEALSAPIEQITSVLERCAGEITRATQHLGALGGQLDAAGRESREQQRATMRNIATAAEQFRQALAAAGNTLRQDRAVLEELEAQARASSAEALRVREAADKVIMTFTAVTRELTDLVRAAASHTPVAPPAALPHENTDAR